MPRFQKGNWLDTLSMKIRDAREYDVTGRFVVARDPEIGDMYVCRILDGSGLHGTNYLCEILTIENYPIQHAILYPDVPHENPPLLPGQRAMLEFVGYVNGLYPMEKNGQMVQASADDWYTAVGPSGYWARFDTCLEDYRKRIAFLLDYQRRHPTRIQPIGKEVAYSEEELVILDRHKNREFKGTRSCLYGR